MVIDHYQWLRELDQAEKTGDYKKAGYFQESYDYDQNAIKTDQQKIDLQKGVITGIQLSIAALECDTQKSATSDTNVPQTPAAPPPNNVPTDTATIGVAAAVAAEAEAATAIGDSGYLPIGPIIGLPDGPTAPVTPDQNISAQPSPSYAPQIISPQPLLPPRTASLRQSGLSTGAYSTGVPLLPPPVPTATAALSSPSATQPPLVTPHLGSNAISHSSSHSRSVRHSVSRGTTRQAGRNLCAASHSYPSARTSSFRSARTSRR